MALVEWDDIYQPKVQVLRAKYGLCESMPESIMRNSCSYMWKAVAKAWPLLRSNMIWSIRDGKTVRCWKDIPNMGPLNQYVPGHSNIVLKTKINGMNDDRGFFGKECILFIDGGVLESKRGGLEHALENSKTSTCETFHLRLLTNSERVKRGIAQDVSRLLCGHIKEDILHILRDCPFAKEVWHNIIPANHLGSFFSGNISKWFFSNLQFLSINKLSVFPWACLFGIILWRIWKNHNSSIFQRNAMNSKDVISISYSWAKHFLSTHNEELASQSKQSPDYQNSGTSIFLNTDGVVHPVSGLSTAGSVIRNSKGEWILGYNRSLGECSVVTAELWGLLDGLHILQKQGYDELIIQSDNLENVISIGDRKSGDPKNSLIRRIEQILVFEENWSLNYAPRDTN
ncbi:reverse transcriptase [Gossypium australe]|uniref:Reverse transcriptase n=1 Tax=Gossypium australe TaxID=47621 RepID=A0A5B6WDQ5_9ROSI|nr:reverse transcriptase [Gossypium australe]